MARLRPGWQPISIAAILAEFAGRPAKNCVADKPPECRIAIHFLCNERAVLAIIQRPFAAAARQTAAGNCGGAEMAAARWLDSAELAKILDDVPSSVKWDFVQLALDLAGIVNPVADAASGIISLLRGDLLGAAISAVSVFPIGDVAKLAKFRKYRASLEQLVALARRNQHLAWALQRPMKQIDELLRGLAERFKGTQINSSVLNEFLLNVDGIRRAIQRYNKHMQKLKLIKRFGAARIARKNGRSSGQWPFKGAGSPPPGTEGTRNWYDAQPVSVNEVVDLLESAKQSSRGQIKDQADRMIEALALSDPWYVTAGVHRSEDATKHITLLVDDIAGQVHLELNKQGRLFLITYGKQGLPF
jgi:hypothetical protein